MLSSLRWSTLFSMPKAAGMQLYLGFGTAPARQPLGDAPTSDNDSPRRAGLSIDELGDLSIDHLNCSGGRVGRGIERVGTHLRGPTLTTPRATLRPDSPD